MEPTSKNILFIDNFDSFTYNVVHYCEALNAKVTVVRNNEIPWSSVMNFNGVVLSPGPGLPEESGYLMAFISTFWNKIPMLGICLGLQAMAIHDEAKLKNLDEVLHGVSTTIRTVGSATLFAGLPEHFSVGHYHSWAVDSEHLPKSFRVTARNSDQLIMAIQHNELPLMAVQFHPESVLTEYGMEMLKNWINSI